jgi:hypothetical protein
MAQAETRAMGETMNDGHRPSFVFSSAYFGGVGPIVCAVCGEYWPCQAFVNETQELIDREVCAVCGFPYVMHDGREAHRFKGSGRQ